MRPKMTESGSAVPRAQDARTLRVRLDELLVQCGLNPGTTLEGDLRRVASQLGVVWPEGVPLSKTLCETELAAFGFIGNAVAEDTQVIGDEDLEEVLPRRSLCSFFCTEAQSMPFLPFGRDSVVPKAAAAHAWLPPSRSELASSRAPGASGASVLPPPPPPLRRHMAAVSPSSAPHSTRRASSPASPSPGNGRSGLGSSGQQHEGAAAKRGGQASPRDTQTKTSQIDKSMMSGDRFRRSLSALESFERISTEVFPDVGLCYQKMSAVVAHSRPC